MDAENTCVIYRILNTTTGKSYIGMTLAFNTRKRVHLRELKKGEHHSLKLQRSYDLHGKDAFKFSVLEADLSIEDALTAESKWIAHFDSYHNGYNMNEGGKGGALRPVEWNGIQYRSLSSAAESEGMSITALSHHIKHGRKGSADVKKRHSHKSPIVIDGMEYPSAEAAAVATGRNIASIVGERLQGLFESLDETFPDIIP